MIGLDRRLVAPGRPATLVAVRSALAIVLAMRLALRRWWSMNRRPPELFDPVVVVSWLSRPVPSWTLVVVQGIGLVACALVVARRHGVLAFAVAWACLLFLAGLWGSSGKVMHNDVLILTACVPMLFAPAPPIGQPDELDERWGWPPRAVLAVVATVYFATGYQKLVHSGLEWVFSDNLSWVLRGGTSKFGPGFTDAVAGQGWLTRSIALGALSLELLAPVLLYVRRTRLLFLAGSVALHGSIWIMMGLDYYAWPLTVAAAVVPTVAPRWATPIADPRPRRDLPSALAVSADG